MRKEIMASFFLAGVALLLGLSGYMVMFNSPDNSTVQENSSSSLVSSIANSTNASVSANNSLSNATAPESHSSANGTVGNQSSAQNATLANQSSSGTQNTTSNTTVTNTTTVVDLTNTSDGSGSSGSSSSGSHHHHHSSNTDNNVVPVDTGATSALGIIHYDDCLEISNGEVCLSDIAVESPNEAILAVYDAQGRHIRTIMLAPNENRNVDLGDGKAIYVSVYDTAINGSDIQSLVYISNSVFDYSREIAVEGTLDLGDCINMSFSSVCLSDVAVDPPNDAILSVYDSQGRLISNVIAPVNVSKTIVIGNGRAISVMVSETSPGYTVGSVWAIVTIRYTIADFNGNLLFYGECFNTSHSSICLEDIGASAPHSAIFRVHNLVSGNESNLMVAPGSSEDLNLDSTKAVSVYVYGTAVNGSSIWALASATEMVIDADRVSGTVGFDDCIHNGAAEVCLYDIEMDSPHSAILKVYNPEGGFVLNKIISPGSSRTVSINGTSSVRISVESTTFDLNTGTFEAELEIENN